jgi:hypothetical protein
MGIGAWWEQITLRLAASSRDTYKEKEKKVDERSRKREPVREKRAVGRKVARADFAMRFE